MLNAAAGIRNLTPPIRRCRARPSQYDADMSFAGHEGLLVPSQHRTIQGAIDAVAGSSSIVIAPGRYAESLHIADGKSVVLQSAVLSRRGVTLSGAGTGPVIHVENSTVHLSGIVVRSNASGRGLLVERSHLNLQECVVAGNRIVDSRGAGMLCRNSTVRLQKSAVLANVIDCAGHGAGGGLWLDACEVEIAGSTIQANVVYAGGEARGGGIAMEGGKMRMWRSRVTDNALYAGAPAGGGMYLCGGARCQIGGSVITGNDSGDGPGGGVFISGDAGGVSVHRNTFTRQNQPTDIELVDSEGH